MVKTISHNEIVEKMESGAEFILVETLPAQYYKKEHLPGAINIPHDEVSRIAPEKLPRKSAFIVVYCASATCPNSTIAAKALTAMGYENVYDYEEGKEGWHKADLKFE